MGKRSRLSQYKNKRTDPVFWHCYDFTRCMDVTDSCPAESAAADPQLGQRKQNMRITLFTLLCSCLGFGCITRSSEDKRPSLGFYVVETEPIPDGRYIDTARFPRLGYVRPMPDLALTRLAGVETGVQVHVKEPFRRRDGTLTGEERCTNDCVDITFDLDTRTSFHKLTEDNLRKKVLFMVGDEPLIAPLVRYPISTPTVRVEVGTNNVLDLYERLKPFVGARVNGQQGH
jgi:hypothetical protein